MIPHEHVACIFRLSSRISELIRHSLSSKPRGAKAPLVSEDAMAYAGGEHTVLLRSDGQAVACGIGFVGQCNIPPLDEGISYSQVSAGRFHTVLLRSDGQAVACGSNAHGQCRIPPLDEGISYSQVSAGVGHTVLLRSDGQAVACGENYDGRCSIPPLDEGISYSQVSAGGFHTVLLRSDGQAVACGGKNSRQCDIPPLDHGLSYSQVSAGYRHTVLLRSDGQAGACGENPDGRCSIPPLNEGISYSQVSAGGFHTVLLRSDGQAVVCGRNSDGQCNIPPLDEGLSYSQVSAALSHTVLLRSDGQVVACGQNSDGQCDIPSVVSGRDWFPFGILSPSPRYINDFKTFPFLGKDRVVQVEFSLEGDGGVILACIGLDGLEVLRLKIQKSDRTVDVCSRVARELNTDTQNLRMVLPDTRFACYNLQSKSILNTFRCDFSLSQNGKHSVALDGRKKCQDECGIPFPCHPIGLGKFAWTWHVVEQCWLLPHHVICTWVYRFGNVLTSISPQRDAFWKAAPRYDNFACACYPLVNSNTVTWVCPTIGDCQAISFPLGNRPFPTFLACNFCFLLIFETTQLQFFFGGDRIILYFHPGICLEIGEVTQFDENIFFSLGWKHQLVMISRPCVYNAVAADLLGCNPSKNDEWWSVRGTPPPRSGWCPSYSKVDVWKVGNLAQKLELLMKGILHQSKGRWL